MNQGRTVRAVAMVTVGYVIVLFVWITWLVKRTPMGTLPYQLAALIAGFGSALGFAMLLANRPTKEQRRLQRVGLEGWAVIEQAHPAEDGTTEFDVELTVPGSDSYSGRIRYTISPTDADRFQPGATISVLVDPKNRDLIVLRP